MNKDELYKLLSEKSSLSKEKIESALKNDASFDTDSLDDFEREALQGWLESDAKNVNMSRVSKNLGFAGSKLNLILSAIVSIILIGVIFWPVFTKERTSPNQIAKDQPKLIEQTDIFIAEKFDTLIEEVKTTEAEIKSLRKTQKSQSKIETTSENENPVFEIDELPLKPIEIDRQTTPVKLDTKKKIKEVYFHSFKLVDYRTLRSKPTISTQQMDLSGTSANVEKRNTKSEDEVEWRTVEVPYIDYINKTMYYMDKGKLKNALARFDLILSSYPDDINAQFYAGFALYNLNEFENAQNKFMDVLQNNIANFDEEAMWYLGLSYEKSGNTVKAREIYKTIAASESFYADMARKKL
jgi:TolA-binding protein